MVIFLKKSMHLFLLVFINRGEYYALSQQVLKTLVFEIEVVFTIAFVLNFLQNQGI